MVSEIPLGNSFHGLGLHSHSHASAMLKLLKSVNRKREERKQLDDKQRAGYPPRLNEDYKKNPHQHGATRHFKVLVGGHDTVHVHEKVHDKDFYADEGHVVRFAGFGLPDKGFQINNTWVPPENIKISADKMNYTFHTPLHEKDGGGNLSGHFNFLSTPNANGFFVLDNGSGYVIQLQPFATEYSISVADGAAAGVTFSPGVKDLTWDPNSSKWQSATFESNAGIFAYDVASNNDPIQPISAIEVGFTDNKSTSPSVPPAYDYGFTVSQFPSVYTAQFDNTGTTFSFSVSDPSTIPPVSSQRSAQTVKSIFPQHLLCQFDEFGSSFTGGYQDAQNKIYAIKGVPNLPFLLAAATPAVATSAAAPAPASKQSQPFIKVKPIENITFSSAATSSLQITGLLNLSPMAKDANGQWYDAVAQTSMNDFYNGIINFMDPTLRSTFISSSLPNIDANARSILASNSSAEAFYQKLQVPFLVNALSGSTQPSAAYLNGARASNVLKDLPANDPVYKQQTTAFYTLRWTQQDTLMQQYLNDQATGDYSTKSTSYATTINNAATALSNNLASRISAVPDPDETLAQNLQAAQTDIQNLKSWAVTHKLYWAFMLMYYCQTTYLPLLQAKMSSGALSQQVSMEIKTLGAVFGVLESGAPVNPSFSFQSSFLDMIRAFELQVVIPQFVDPDGNTDDFNEIYNGVMDAFIATYSNNASVQNEVASVQQLRTDQVALKSFLDTLITTSRTSASLTTWSSLVSKFQVVCQSSSWYTKLANGASYMSTFLRLTLVAEVILPLVQPGGWNALTDHQRAQIITNSVGLFVTFTIKIAQGVLRLATFWSDVTPFFSRAKLFFGSETVEGFGEAASKFQSGFGKWLVRTSRESMELGTEEFSTALKIFGRNASEFLSNVVGTVLGLVNIGLAAWDIATTSDPLQKAMDSLNILSASFSLIGIAAGWLSGIAATAEGVIGPVIAVTALESIAAFTGPAAVVFAVAGMIVMIVMQTRHQDPPDPIKDFAVGQAQTQGLYMPQQIAIDYFNIIPSSGPGSQSLSGLAFQNTTGNQYLMISVGSQTSSGIFSAPVLTNGALTYAPNTCFGVQTDGTGLTTIWTTSALADGSNPTNVCLAIDSNNNVVAITPPAQVDANGNPVNPTTYANQVAQQRWVVNCITNLNKTVTVQSTNYPTQAIFTVQSKASGQYLVVDPATKKMAMSSTAQNWFCTMNPIGPSLFTYSTNPWILLTTSEDESIVPQMNAPGSEPLSWSVSPDLPAGLQLLDSSGDLNAGTITIISGETPAQTPSTVYTVTASITINGASYSQSTEVTIEVDEDQSTSS